MKLAHHYAYARPSALSEAGLRLATSTPPDHAAPFLEADARRPRAVALALRTVSEVVGMRYHVPAAMLARILREADPVLTWGGDLLRVEGFSGCCGVYARADIGAAALAPRDARHGTTNVDFNAPLRAALARVRDNDPLAIRVGVDGVAVDAGGDPVVERRVALPLRWIRGFLEVQAVQRRMTPRLRLDRAGAVRFLRALPRHGRASDATWVVASGRGARLSARGRGDAVRVAGIQRLRTLEPLLPLAGGLDVHVDPVTGASAWRLEAGEGVGLTLALSPETWRGFSGEGQALEDLAGGAEGLARVRAALRWQAELSPAALAAESGLDAEAVDGALAWLATRGLVGWDVGRGAWFHRVLPFDLDAAVARIEAQHPRLAGARRLLERPGAVTLLPATAPDTVEARVAGTGVTHVVHLRGDEARCTCPWYARHRDTRGPCKHILAAQLAWDEQEIV